MDEVKSQSCFIFVFIVFMDWFEAFSVNKEQKPGDDEGLAGGGIGGAWRGMKVCSEWVGCLDVRKTWRGADIFSQVTLKRAALKPTGWKTKITYVLFLSTRRFRSWKPPAETERGESLFQVRNMKLNKPAAKRLNAVGCSFALLQAD